MARGRVCEVRPDESLRWEIERAAGNSVLVPFTAQVVPAVDIAGGRVVVAPPAGLLDTAAPRWKGRPQ